MCSVMSGENQFKNIHIIIITTKVCLHVDRDSTGKKEEKQPLSHEAAAGPALL